MVTYLFYYFYNFEFQKYVIVSLVKVQLSSAHWQLATYTES